MKTHNLALNLGLLCILSFHCAGCTTKQLHACIQSGPRMNEHAGVAHPTALSVVAHGTPPENQLTQVASSILLPQSNISMTWLIPKKTHSIMITADFMHPQKNHAVCRIPLQRAFTKTRTIKLTLNHNRLDCYA